MGASTQPQEGPLQLVETDVAAAPSDPPAGDPVEPISGVEHRIADLERELRGAAGAVLAEVEQEAAQIRNDANERAHAIIADAEREAAAILEAGRERFQRLEEDALQRAEQLDARHQELTMELEVMGTMYDELQSTLKLVAETAFNDLTEAKTSLMQLDEDRTPLPQRRSYDAPALTAPPSEED